MKKYFIPFVLIVSVVFLHSESETDVSITDYFPIEPLTCWSYAGISGEKEFLIVFIKDSSPSDKYKNETLLTFEEQWIATNMPCRVVMGATGVLYGLRENKVLGLVRKNLAGQYTEYEHPFPLILAKPNTIWTYNDRGEYLQYFTSKASCKFDDKVFSDCILVEEKLKDLDNDRILRIKKSYYAKYVGLVYVTLTGKDGKESVFMKLKETSLLKK